MAIQFDKHWNYKQNNTKINKNKTSIYNNWQKPKKIKSNNNWKFPTSWKFTDVQCTQTGIFFSTDQIKSGLKKHSKCHVDRSYKLKYI